MILLKSQLAVGDGILVVLFPTTVILKTCSVLVYMICFEAMTFAGLFMYRMAPHNPYTPKVIASGLIIFGVTRPIQVIWVFAGAFGAWVSKYFSFLCCFVFLFERT